MSPLVADPRLSRFIGPRYWPIWLLLGLVRLLAAFSHRWRLRVGAALGRLAMQLLATRRHNAERNLGLCLAEYPQRARHSLLAAHFRSLGIALVESGLAWWADDASLRPLVTVEGLERLQQVRAQGRGALLLAAHFTSLEIGARLLAMQAPLDVVYQQHSNPLVEAMLRRGRTPHVGRLIRNDQPRELLQSLRAGHAVWYAPDQTYPAVSSLRAPFFGIDAMTNTTATKLAQRTGAALMPYFVHRRADGSYRIVIEPELPVAARHDRLAAAVQLNRIVEAQIRREPAQYLWIHRRFRRHTNADPDYYAAP